MARAEDTDPLKSFNYYMLDVPLPVVIPTAFPFKLGISATESRLLSFQTITVPTVEHEVKEIQEGNWPFKHYVLAGRVSSGNVTIRAAVTPLSMDFFLWFHQGVWGKAGPRRNFTIVHTRGPEDEIPRRSLYLEGCIPMSWKPAGDFDASSSAISIEELTMAVHRVESIPGPP